MQTGVFYIYKCFTRYEQAEVDSITNLRYNKYNSIMTP